MVVMSRIPCPKCGRSLAPDGEAVLGDQVFPVYSCDECVMTVEMFGETMELPLTFALDADGKPFDPASPDGKLQL